MRFEELRNLTKIELQDKLTELQREQLKIRIANATGQSVKTHLIRIIRKNIARVKTVINEQPAELV